jgi:hypothetical protein
MLTTEELIKKFPLGRNKSDPDFDDYKLAAFIPKGTMALGTIGSKKWEFPAVPLNQSPSGHCVGFSMADWGICLPVHDEYTNQTGHDFYYKCKAVDGEPGQENGSCVRSAAKVLKDEGLIDGYAFAGSIEEIKWWIINRGPVIAGTVWTEDMFLPDMNNTVRPTGKIVGGHAYLLTEWREDNYIGIQNSWNDFWGIDGKAYISANDFKALFIYDGEAMAAVELETPIRTNSFLNFIEMLLKIIIAGKK